MNDLPPLPLIEGELILEVYTHQSLNVEPGAPTPDENGGSARLAILGKTVLESAVMTNLFQQRPMYSPDQLCVSNPSTVVVSGFSEVWRVGIDRGLDIRGQCRSMGNWLQPKE